jgi:hypothetical protein
MGFLYASFLEGHAYSRVTISTKLNESMQN